MDAADSPHCCLLHPSLCWGYHQGSCYPACFLTCARPPSSIPVKPSNSTSWCTAGNSTGAKGPLWGEQTILYIQSQNTRRTIPDSFTTLKKKKSHSFLTKLLSVWGSDISKGQFTNKLGFFWQTELLLGVLLIISWPCLKKKKTKTNKPKENTLVWLHKQKGPQANARQQGACRSYKAT